MWVWVSEQVETCPDSSYILNRQPVKGFPRINIYYSSSEEANHYTVSIKIYVLQIFALYSKYCIVLLIGTVDHPVEERFLIAMLNCVLANT
ncbi:hypothetical protein GDO81_003452 [Engystomops pustulosus]|uniref:Uncharacterized protein n=1 Tax=Engystomops pustulosus TaxID=76066 RepID=A0AAV6ZX15_ENGPU|nr:hypothetical protein GDO81_003452 [Engystomops pustulosus]